jgi:MoaA/NifB/PqqE/SkfB family radical SAM enzyme
MPDSSVLPCCVSPYEDVYGDGKKENLVQIWNSEKFKTLRLNMLNQTPSAGCARCYSLEKSGFKSMRQEMNHLFHDYFPLTQETRIDGSLEKLELKYIDIRFSNLCNFKCRSCGPALSSSWQKDHEILYNYKGDEKIKSIPNSSPSFWREIHSLIPHADIIYFGGGEPLITKEHYEILSLLNTLGKYNIDLRYTTNLSQLNYGNFDLFEAWKNFKNITLGISIDDLEERAEYFRHGTKWGVIKKNLELLMHNHPQIKRTINCTVNLSNIYHFPEIYEFAIINKIVKPADFNVNLLLDPVDLRVDVLPSNLKKKINTRLTKFKFKLLTLGPSYLRTIRDIDSILKFMNGTDNSHYLPQFREKTLKLDQIRDEKFATVYPELSELLLT